MQRVWHILGVNKYEIIRGRKSQVTGDHELNASDESHLQIKITVQKLRQEIENL